MIAIVIVIVMPLAVVWALSKSASLRGPAVRPESRKPVGALVTDVIPEEHPEEDEAEDQGPDFRIDSEAPDPDQPGVVKPLNSDDGSAGPAGTVA